MRGAIASTLAVLAVVWASAPSRGAACGNAVYATEKNIAAVKEAEKILDERGVLATPHAYGGLAGLRGGGGDEAGRDEALARCRRMAKVDAICKIEQPTP